MELEDKIQNLLSNPPVLIEWREMVGGVIREHCKPSRVVLLCSCGTTKKVRTSDVLSLRTKSCGCYQKKYPSFKTHGQRFTKLWYVWQGMKQRVYNPKHKSYKNYGERGIQICDSWIDSFENFRDWSIATGYEEGLTLERNDNDKDYCPENCKWTTPYEQNRNKRSNNLVTINGETLCIQDHCKKWNISSSLVWHRVNMGMSYDEALKAPKKNQENTTLFITIGMVTLSLRDWCKELSINPATVKYRVKSGWSWEDAILKPSQRAKIKQSN